MSYQCKIKCQGKDGDQGITGPTGFAGPTGSSSTGPTGFPGPTGPGITGPTGPDGQSGPAGVPAFAEVFSVGTMLTVNPGESIPFNFTGPITTPGFSHAPGSTDVGVDFFGVYDIRFSVTSLVANQFSVAVNGLIQSAGTYGTGMGLSPNTGEIIVTIFPVSIIRLVNTSGAPVTFTAAVGGPNATTNASMHIIQLL